MNADFECRNCRAPLRRHTIRCQSCGATTVFALNGRQNRDLVLSLGLMSIAIVLALLIAVVFSFVADYL